MNINPYADFGSPVVSKRFIGREEELRLIQSRIFGEGGYGSLAIVGLPRTGKTSLILEAIRRNEVILKQRRIIAVRLEVGTFKSVQDLFKNLMSNLLEEIQENGLSDDKIELCFRKVIENLELSFDVVRSAFRLLRRQNLRLVCVLDEFDAGRYIFNGMPELFHWLRELGSNPDFKVAIVLVSKRQLQDVARLAGHDSNYWANVLMTLKLRSFSESELSIFFSNLEKNGIIINNSICEELIHTCGGQPYLLDAFAYHAYEKILKGNTIDISLVQKILRGIVHDYFKQVAAVLKDGLMLGKTIQALIGPNYDVTPDDIEFLLDYGVFKRCPDGSVKAFINTFEDYLRLIEESVDIWPLWRNTEKQIREVLQDRLKAKFGKNWPENLKKSQIKIAPLIDKYQEIMAREHERFGTNASENLLAYTYPHDLYQIMTIDWAFLGEPIFGKDKSQWSTKFSLLSKVRTPLAHNREEILKLSERQQAEGFCNEILERIERWYSSK